MVFPPQVGRQQKSVFFLFPWTFLLIGYLVGVHWLELRLQGPAGYAFVGLGVIVIFIEFFKSGDIDTHLFFIDLLGAVAAVVAATVLMCYLYFSLDRTPGFFHWFGYALVLGDALFSPFNSFRTALRNFGVAG